MHYPISRFKDILGRINFIARNQKFVKIYCVVTKKGLGE